MVPADYTGPFATRQANMRANICRTLAATSLLVVAPVIGLTSCDRLPTDVQSPPNNPPTPQPGSNNPPASIGHVVIKTQTQGLDGPLTLLLEVDLGAVTRRQILSTDSLSIDVEAGSHSVGITGISSNCEPDPGLSQRITVAKDSTIAVRFDLRCVAVTGVVRATVTTSGPGTDPTGYSARLDGGTSFQLGSNGTFYLFPINGGAQSLTLMDIASNCRLNGDAYRSFSITVGGLKRDTVDIAWNLECNKITLIAFRRGNIDPRIATEVVTADTSGSQENSLWSGFAPAWSPNADELAFGVIDCFYYSPCFRGGLTVMSSSGTTQWWLTHDGRDEDPAWRPDGAFVAFTRADVLHLVDATYSLGRVTPIPTPSGMRRVAGPSWSPDGKKIAVMCEMDDGRREICVVDANTFAFVRLTNNDSEDTDPAWSPDGSQIAFSLKAGDQTSVAVMNSAGGAITTLTTGKSPAWSPDGAMLLFEATPPARGIFRFTLESGAVVRITSGDDHDPAWHP